MKNVRGMMNVTWNQAGQKNPVESPSVFRSVSDSRAGLELSNNPSTRPGQEQAGPKPRSLLEVELVLNWTEVRFSEELRTNPHI